MLDSECGADQTARGVPVGSARLPIGHIDDDIVWRPAHVSAPAMEMDRSRRTALVHAAAHLLQLARIRENKGLRLRYLLTATLIVATAIVLLGTTADPDLWGHVRFGEDIVVSGALHADTYSFTDDRPWINHEWLAEVAMALAFRAGGAAGLNLLRLVAICLVLLIVWSVLKGDDLVRRLQLLAMLGLGVLLRVHPVRPQLFSVLLFALLLLLIVRSEERDSPAPIAVVPVLMAGWVNLHGGWILGLGTLWVWIAGKVVTKRTPSDRPVLLAALGLAALLATAVNPYGIEMWRFLFHTLGMGRPVIADWQPMYALPPAFAALWLIPAGVSVFAAARAPKAVDRTHLALVALLGLAALRVSRLDAFFALAAFIFLGPVALRASGRPPVPLATFPRLVAVATAAVVIAIGVRQLPRLDMPPTSPEPDAARYIRERRLAGRMLTWFDWGEYAIWHFGPRIRVSMDGRRETVYTDEVTTAHLKFYAGSPGFVDYPDRIGAEYIWLPRGLPVVPQLQAAGWRPAFEGPVSVLLTRSDQLVTVRSTAPGGRRVFPSM
jgi:hypothetical protein